MKSALQQGQGKKISIGLMIIIMAFMVVLPMVSASDFDNIVVDIPVEKGDTIIFDGRVIEYNPIWEKYAPVKIDNAFGMGSTLAEAYIEQHTDNCGLDCLSVFDIKTYGKSALVDDIRFNKLNEKGDWIRSNVRSYQFFVWDNPLSREESYLENVCTSTYNEETGDEISKSCENIPRTRTIYYKIIDDVQWICSPSGKFEVNGTAIQTCKDVVVGKKEYVYDGWVFYNIGDIKDAGKYKVKLIGDKRSEWIYDWQITTQGKIISSWAVWGVGGNISSGLVAHYKMNDNLTTTNIIDSVNGINNGTLMGALNTTNSSQAGKINMSVGFDGVNDYIGIFGNPSLNISGNISLSAWVYFRSSIDGKIVGKSTSTNYFGLDAQGTKIVYYADSPAGKYILSSVLSKNNWYHIVATQVDNTSNIYINGVLNSTGTTISLTPIAASWIVGKGSTWTGKYFNGSIDDVRIYNRSLSATEISTLYAGGLGTEETTSGVVVLNSPAEGSTQYNNPVTFNCSASMTGGAALTNISLWTNESGIWKVNQTRSLAPFDSSFDVVAGWNMDEGTGILVKDILGINNGTNFGTWASGIIGNATSLDSASSQNINISSSNTLNFGTGNATISLWIYSDSLTSSSLIQKRPDITGPEDGYRIILDRSYPSTNAMKYGFDGTPDIILTLPEQAVDKWYNIIMRREACNVSLWWNGTMIQSYNDGCANQSNTNTLSIGGGATGFFDGRIDEVYFWNRALNLTEISDLYNSGEGRYYVNNLDARTVTFNLSLAHPVVWNCLACDDDSTCGYGTNRTVYMDTAPPTISIIYPNGTIPYGYIGQNISLNYSITDTNLQTCWFGYNGTNTTIPCALNYTMILTTQKNITMYANDSLGNKASAYSTWDYTTFEINQTYSTTAYETSTENFYLNLNYNSSAVGITAILNYDGINHTAINIGSGDNGLFKATITIPLITTSANKTFFWYINNVTGIGYNQTVNPIILQLCNATYNVSALNFTYYDESNLLPINATANNTIIKSTFGYWIGDGSVKKAYSYQNLTATTNTFSFCISPPSLNMTIDLAMEYGASDYLDNNYELQNNVISNVTRNITLYLLPINLGTKFTHTLRRGIDFIPDTLISIGKYFVGIGQWKNIGIRNTDNTGRFVQYLELDKRYNYTVQNDNGSIIASIENTAICLTAPCEITLQIDTVSSTVFSEMEAYIAQNVLYTLTYNKTIKMVNLNYTDLTGTAHYWRMWVYKPYFGNETMETICNITSYTVSGTMECNTTGYYGDIVAKVYISRSPEVIVDFLTFLNEDRTEALGTSGLLASILILLVIIFTASRSATGALIMIPFGLVILKFLGFLPLSWGVVVGVVVFITIIAMKMRT